MFGAKIERGKILAAEEGGYIVASTDRPGIETGPLTPISENTYTAGDAVYFFVFPDGTGKIISAQ